MRTYSGKTIEEAVAEACQDLGMEETSLIFKVNEEKKGLFNKKAEIEVYEMVDIVDYAESYLKGVLESLGLGEVKTNTSLEDDIIRIEINTDHNPIIIGKNGTTLQALNEITRLAVSGKFKRRFRILLDVGDYKSSKYSRVVNIARRTAKEVQKSHVDATLLPMPSDERRVIHNALANFSHIKTESSGEGNKRAITIKYVD